jgi:hypothetical protein
VEHVFEEGWGNEGHVYGEEEGVFRDGRGEGAEDAA